MCTKPKHQTVGTVASLHLDAISHVSLPQVFDNHYEGITAKDKS